MKGGKNPVRDSQNGWNVKLFLNVCGVYRGTVMTRNMASKTTKCGSQQLAKTDYNAMLEAYYDDLLLQEKAGAISPLTHRALDTFLHELRELVAKSNPPKLAEAA